MRKAVWNDCCRPMKQLVKMVGVRGFEPPAPASRSKRLFQQKTTHQAKSTVRKRQSSTLFSMKKKGFSKDCRKWGQDEDKFGGLPTGRTSEICILCIRIKKDNFYTKPKGWGAYTPGTLMRTINSGIHTRGRRWSRPEPYWSFIERLRHAFDVLTYKADALYWKERDEASALAGEH